jgi:hypothetical protein
MTFPGSDIERKRIRVVFSQRLLKRIGLVWLVIIWASFVLSTPGTPGEWEGFPVLDSEDSVEIERFYYDMRGSVRLLFFWIGKSGVGGGWISRIQSVGQTTSRIDGWEVLFGSKPETVPGGHNRWGYARELAYWGQAESDLSEPVLEKTVFEGFMTLSKEDSLAEVRRDEYEGGSGGVAFEGTISSVHSEEASVEIRRFVSDSGDSFESPATVGLEYLDLVKLSYPDEERTLEYEPSALAAPYGFLTAVNSGLLEVIKAASDKDAWKRLKNQERSYVYNARHYALKIKKIKHHDEVEVGDDLMFEDVLEVDFEARRKSEKRGHSFSVWTSSKGRFAGIPIKIVDKPRWWLKVELTLKDQKPTKITKSSEL